MHRMRQYTTEVMFDGGEKLWRFTWHNAERAEAIATSLQGTGLDFEVHQGYSVRDREWDYSATITFQGTPRQAEALFRAINAKSWDISEMRVEVHDIEATLVQFGN